MPGTVLRASCGTGGTVCLRLCCRLELICSVSWDLSCLEWNVTLIHPNPSVLIRKLSQHPLDDRPHFYREKNSLAPFLLSILRPPRPEFKLNKQQLHSMLSRFFSTLMPIFMRGFGVGKSKMINQWDFTTVSYMDSSALFYCIYSPYCSDGSREGVIHNFLHSHSGGK